MTTLADLIAEVAAEHVAQPDSWCAECRYSYPDGCPAARLAAALSPENVAAGLERIENEVRASGVILGLDTAVSDYAAALLAAITVAG